jgi:reactive intermediate/imine deaminase
MQFINSPDLPPSAGHYSQAVAHGGVLYLSGQLPIHPGTKEVPETLDAQVAQVFSNLRAVLSAAGSSLNQLLQVRVYITDIEHWPAFNAAYARILGAHRPARCVVPVGSLHFGCLIEVEATAAL